jgi:hypothetical protein
MIDFGEVRRFIYFPRKIERRADPYVIHVLDKWGASWRGNVELDKLLAREYNFFDMQRCQPYSDVLWAKCVQWVEKRDLLEAEYVHLMLNGVSNDL